jgi:DNA modification methylase
VGLIFERGSVALRHGDCLAILPTLDDESIDAIVTDPPYLLQFMGKAWDSPTVMSGHNDPTRPEGHGGAAHDHGVAGHWQPNLMQQWHEAWAREAFRVAKPGAHLLAFGGTRTVHRMTSAIEDAGWEIRDTLVWAYASGFPKSLDVSKAIDKAAQPNIETHRRIAAVGEVIRQHREAKGLTPQQVSAAVVGTPSGACWNWEHIQLPSLDKWPAIKAALGIPDRYDALLEGDRSRFIAAEREVVGTIRKNQPGGTSAFAEGGIGAYTGDDSERPVMGAPATDAAREWQGWGSALKPAWEPIVMARKPLRGTVAGNVQEYGTGALNIDGTRIPFDAPPPDRMQRQHADTAGMNGLGESGYAADHVQPLFDQRGRWPANVILTDPIFDGDTPGVVGGGEQSSPAPYVRSAGAVRATAYGEGMGQRDAGEVMAGHGDSGTYSRFFLIPKAARRDREPLGHKGERVNTHPTVKPTALMAHLIRLVTPPGGTVLEPFAGSGSTLVAADREKVRIIGIERDEESCEIIVARLNAEPDPDVPEAPRPKATRKPKVPPVPGQTAMDFG